MMLTGAAYSERLPQFYHLATRIEEDLKVAPQGQPQVIAMECGGESHQVKGYYMDLRLLDDGDLIWLVIPNLICRSLYIPRSGGVKAS